MVLDGIVRAGHGVTMTTLRSTVESVLRKAPDWVRHELASRDMQERQRAEDALAAMIEAALSVTEPTE